MATQIPMWKSRDGKVFETQAKADAHDEAVKTMRRFQISGGFYQQLVAILENYTLVPRAYPSKEDNND